LGLATWRTFAPFISLKSKKENKYYWRFFQTQTGEV
jgi:hypothetical protein